MKKRFLLFSLLFPLVTHAQSIEFEMIRTEESPGFFALRLFASPESTPIPIHFFFIKNYAVSEAADYEPLFPALQDLGAEIIDADHIATALEDPDARLFVLGEPKGDYPTFTIHEKEQVIEAFEQFSTDYLGSVFFRDITLQFGGNVSAVIPEKIDYLGEEPILVVGKFEKPMRTYSVITAESAEDMIEASTDLELRTYQPHPLAAELPDIWEKRVHPPEIESPIKAWILSLFPWVLGGGGIVILLFIFAFVRRMSRSSNTDLSDTLLEDDLIIPQAKPLFEAKKPLEDALPFEVKKQL